jgi:hypothetical protein
VDVRPRGEDDEGGRSAARSLTPKIQELRQQIDGPRARESYEIEALCAAQRLRSPLAIAVAEDYSATPFKVPREFIVLGWFWVIDAWVSQTFSQGDAVTEEQVEPATDDRAVSKQVTTVVSPPKVQWKFRFEWCEPQSPPWWPSRHEPAHIPTPSLRWPYTEPLQPFQQLNSDRRTVGGKDLGENDPDVFCCPECKTRSKRVYDDGFNTCLNEACQYFFHRFVSKVNGSAEASEGGNGMARSDRLTEIVAVERLMPGSLGLKLRPDIPASEGKEGRDYAGGEWWRAWVCDVCGMANERRKWEEWDCTACGVSLLALWRIPRGPADSLSKRCDCNVKSLMLSTSVTPLGPFVQALARMTGCQTGRSLPRWDGHCSKTTSRLSNMASTSKMHWERVPTSSMRSTRKAR